jgi:nucleoid-associated protein YgaU
MRTSVALRRMALVGGAAPLLVALGCCRPAASMGAGPDAAIIAAATWTAWLAAAYLLAGIVAAVVTTSRPMLARALIPSALAAAVAVAVGSGGVATADSGPAGRAHPRPPALSLDWPVGPGAQPATVVVGRGDCLWRIAARAFRRPTSARIAAAWPQWWDANRGVIGADPELIHPGQRLVPPTLSRRQS